MGVVRDTLYEVVDDVTAFEHKTFAEKVGDFFRDSPAVGALVGVVLIALGLAFLCSCIKWICCCDKKRGNVIILNPPVVTTWGADTAPLVVAATSHHVSATEHAPPPPYSHAAKH